MKQRFLALLSTIALLGGLSSCSNEESKNTIYFWVPSGQTIVNKLTNYAEKFSELVLENEGVEVHVEVSYQGGYDDLLDKIVKGFSTGNYPTLAIAYPDHVAEYLDAEGTDQGKYVVNIEDYAKDETIGFGKESYLGDGAASDFVSAFYEEGHSYGREGLYSLPLMKSSEVLYYNTEAVLQCAKPYGETIGKNISTADQLEDYLNSIDFDELMDFCAFIKTYYEENYPDQNLLSPFFYDSDDNLYLTASYQNDIAYTSVDTSGKGSIDFNNPEAKAMAQKLRDYHDQGLIATKGSEGEYGSNYFTTQAVLFDVGSSGGAGYQAPNSDSFTVGVCRVPPFKADNPLYVSQGLSATILKRGDDKNGFKAEYGFKFLKYLTSTAVNADLCVNGSEGYIPVRESCYETDLYKMFMETGESGPDYNFMGKTATIVKEQINGKYFNTPCFKGSAQAREAVSGIITQMFTTDETLDKIFSDQENIARNAL